MWTKTLVVVLVTLVASQTLLGMLGIYYAVGPSLVNAKSRSRGLT